MAPADEAKLAFHLAGFHQLGQYQLRQHRVAEVRVPLGGYQGVPVPRRREHPPHPQRGGQQLGHASRVADMLGEHRAQGGDRRPVVPVLGVIVVLDDQASVPGPSDQLAAAFAVEHHSGRKLMRRGQQDRRGAAGPELVDPQAAGIDRDRRGIQLPVAQLLAGAERSGIFHPDRADSAGEQPLGQQAQRLRDAGHDADLIRVHPDPAVAGQPAGHGLAQRGRPARISVPEPGRRKLAEYRPFRAQPGRPRERGQVGQAG